MTHYKLSVRLVDDSEEVLFYNVGGNEGIKGYKGGRGGSKYDEIKVQWYCCAKIGHIAREWPRQKEVEA